MARYDKTAMDSYLDEIARYPLMTGEEEIELGRTVKIAEQLKQLERPLTREEKLAVKRGDRAKRRFVEANLRLVVYIAKRYQCRNPVAIDMLDLIQEGAVGLMRAAEKFDPERGYKFSTYSYWWCRQAMTRALHTQERLIRRPHTVIEMAGKLPKAIHEETLRLGRPPKPKELAVKLKVKESEILLLMERGSVFLSLDAMIAGVDDRALIDAIPDPTTMDSEQSDIDLDLQIKWPILELCLSKIDEADRKLLEMRYGINGYAPHTYEAIAQGAGVSRERIRQLLERATRKLKFQLATYHQEQCDSRRDAESSAPARAHTPPRRQAPVPATPLNRFPTVAEVQALRCAS